MFTTAYHINNTYYKDTVDSLVYYKKLYHEEKHYADSVSRDNYKLKYKNQ